MPFKLSSFFNIFGNRKPSKELLAWLREREEWYAGAEERRRIYDEMYKRGGRIDFARKNFDPELLSEPLRSEAIEYLRKREC